MRPVSANYRGKILNFKIVGELCFLNLKNNRCVKCSEKKIIDYTIIKKILLLPIQNLKHLNLRCDDSVLSHCATKLLPLTGPLKENAYYNLVTSSDNQLLFTKINTL